MSIRIGLYDIFAYTIPGVLYIIVALFGLSTFGFITIDLNLISNLSITWVLGLLGFGYVTGLLLDPLAHKWIRLFIPKNRDAKRTALASFRQKHPWVTFEFAPDDWPILLNAVKIKSFDIAMEVEQHNVLYIMLRNISFGFLLAAVNFLLIFSFVYTHFGNLVLAVVSLGLSYSAAQRCRLRRHWFYSRIYESYVACYLPPEEIVARIPVPPHTNQEEKEAS
jgi:hypothetical protein